MNIPKYIELYRKELILKNYADNTIKNYCFQVEYFLKNHQNDFTEPSKVNERVIKEWLLQFKTRNAMCHSISALKLFYKMVVKQPLKFKYIEYPRSEKKLPLVINKEYLLEKINGIQNSKHKAIIALAYSTGMRVSEVVNLKIEDFDLESNLIFIRNSKGRKDRVVPLSSTVRGLLRLYWNEYKPICYVFNGQGGGKYSARSCNEIVKKYLGEKFHFHTLRHSALTNLAENQVNLSVIQKIAGHSSPKTSSLYIHLSTNSLNNLPLAI
jgi:site-specific recombinase XerD